MAAAAAIIALLVGFIAFSPLVETLFNPHWQFTGFPHIGLDGSFDNHLPKYRK
jgi:hypothetical protein